MEEVLLLMLGEAVGLWSSPSSEVEDVSSSLELMVSLRTSLTAEEGHLLMLGAAAASLLTSIGAVAPCSVRQ